MRLRDLYQYCQEVGKKYPSMADEIMGFYDLAEMEVFSFLTLIDSLLFFAVFKNLSNPPLKSTVLTAAFVTLSFMFFFNISLANFTFFKFGKNLLLVLLLE